MSEIDKENITGGFIEVDEIWIHWGGKLYGPYRDRAHAAEDGFRVPEGD